MKLFIHASQVRRKPMLLAIAVILVLSPFAGITPGLADNLSLGSAIPGLSVSLGGAPVYYPVPPVAYVPPPQPVYYYAAPPPQPPGFPPVYYAVPTPVAGYVSAP